MTYQVMVLKGMNAEDMIGKLLDPEFEDDGVLANDLLSEFFRGYPIENLKSLLKSDLISAQSTGSFIATELGTLAAPLLEDIALLLNHPSPRTRYDALDSLRQCSTYNDGWAIAAVLRHLEDPWPGVRMGAMDTIRVSDRRALLSGFEYLKTKYPKSVYAKFGKAFLKAERGNNEVVQSLIFDSDPVARRFGAGLAARPRLVVDAACLNSASMSTDSEISEYVEQAQRQILPPWATFA